MPSYKFNEAVLNAMVKLEGMTIEEAKLSYAQREKLPAGAFCGPDRTYPCHDEAHIRNAIVRLMTYKPTGWRKILSCVCGRAKKAKIDSEVCKKAGFNEAKVLDWWEKKHKKEFCATC